MLPGELGTPPTVTTTGCTPTGVFAGTVKLIWVTPLMPRGIARNVIGAFTPATVTDDETTRPLGDRTTLDEVTRSNQRAQTSAAS